MELLKDILCEIDFYKKKIDVKIYKKFKGTFVK